MGRSGNTRKGRKTPPGELEKLPQFQPGRFSAVFPIDPKTNRALRFPPDREEKIIGALSEAIQDYVQNVQFNGMPTSLERFLENALIAISIYENRCANKPAFDRKRAKRLLISAENALGRAQSFLQQIAEWGELSYFLEIVFMSSMRANRTPSTQAKGNAHEIARGLKVAMKASDKEREQYRKISPERLVWDISRLTLLTRLAAERSDFQPGDYRRDEISQELANDLALAWMKAANDNGCTPIDNPGPRWSGYVHKLRKAGIVIETIREEHGGPFSGQHARYVLRSLITILEKEGGKS